MNAQWFTILPGQTVFDTVPDACMIRKAVFVEEQEFPLDIEFDALDQTALHLVLYLDDGSPVATGRLCALPGNRCKLGRIAVLLPYRKRHLGAALLREMEEKARSLGMAAIHISAQDRAQGFYEKLGYQSLGGFYLDDGYPHIDMVKRLS